MPIRIVHCASCDRNSRTEYSPVRPLAYWDFFFNVIKDYLVMINFFTHYFATAIEWVLDPYCWVLIFLSSLVQFLLPGCKPQVTPDLKIDWGHYPHVLTVSTCLGFLGFLSHW